MDLYKIREKLCMGIPLSEIKLKVTDYSRVSTDHIEQKQSLKNQIDHFDEMIKKNPNWTYIPGYIDEGISGTNDIKRNSFMQMINDAKENKFDLIITKEISRFSRNTLDSIKYTRELLNCGVAVLFVNDNINTALPDSELRLTIMASMAQDEIRRLSERVKFGMHESIKKGNILGNNQLYGYRKDIKTKKFVINLQEAEIVKKIYIKYALDKISLSSIAKELNKENIHTLKNKKWTVTTLKRLIQNPKYKGYYCGNKSEVVDYMTKKIKRLEPNKWITYASDKIPKIVNEKIWNLANERLKKRSTTKYNYENRYLYSSKIICKNDECIFHRRKQCKNDISWMCSNYLKFGKNTCSTPNIRESELTKIFIDLLPFLNIDLNNITVILLNIYKKYNNNIQNYDKEIKNLKNRKEKLLNIYFENLITKKELKEKVIKINQEIEILKNNNQILEYDNIKEYITKYIKSHKIIKNIIDLILKKIIANKLNDNNIQLDIYLDTDKYLKKEYIFKRGYNSTSTKRYQIKYHIQIMN